TTVESQRQNRANRMMMGIGTPSSQSKMERPMEVLRELGFQRTHRTPAYSRFWNATGIHGGGCGKLEMRTALSGDGRSVEHPCRCNRSSPRLPCCNQNRPTALFLCRSV